MKGLIVNLILTRIKILFPLFQSPAYPSPPCAPGSRPLRAPSVPVRLPRLLGAGRAPRRTPPVHALSIRMFRSIFFDVPPACPPPRRHHAFPPLAERCGRRHKTSGPALLRLPWFLSALVGRRAGHRACGRGWSPLDAQRLLRAGPAAVVRNRCRHTPLTAHLALHQTGIILVAIHFLGGRN